MASKNSKKYKRLPKHFRQKGLPGRHRNIVYVDQRSNHPFVSQSEHGKTIYGHNVTHSPSLNYDGSIKRKYRKFPLPIRVGDKKPSFFDTTLEKIDNTPREGKTTGRLKRKDWPLLLLNKKKLKQVEKKRLEALRKKKNAR